MSEYYQKFYMHGQTAFIVGGAGLLGKHISHATAFAGARTIILDVNDENGINYRYNGTGWFLFS